MKQLSVLLLISLLAVSCKKEDDNKPAQTGNFSITGVRDADLSVTSDGTYSYNISVVPNSGMKDTVSLSSEQAPGGVYVNFSPSTGVTPFTSRVTFSTDFSSSGGTFPLRIVGTGRSGSRSYDMNVTLGLFRGWQLGTIFFDRISVTKTPGTASSYPTIKVLGPSGEELVLSFAAKAVFPQKTTTYRIAYDSSTLDNLEITLNEGARVYRATGYNIDGTKGATGTLYIDTLKRATFKCVNVEMSDGTQKLPLTASFSE